MGDWPLLVVVTIAQTNRSHLPGDSSVGEPLWTWIKSTSVTSLKHWGGGNNNNNSKDGVCLWRAEILDCCLRGKSKSQGSRSQSLIDWPYWNHFIVYQCSSACSLSPGSSTGSIKPATLISGTNHANPTICMDYSQTHTPSHSYLKQIFYTLSILFSPDEIKMRLFTGSHLQLSPAEKKKERKKKKTISL